MYIIREDFRLIRKKIRGRGMKYMKKLMKKKRRKSKKMGIMRNRRK